MANNFIQFSEMIPHLTEEEGRWLKEQLEVIFIHAGKEYTEADLPKGLSRSDLEWSGCRAYRDLDGFDPAVDEGAGFAYAFDLENDDPTSWGSHLWVYAEEYGELERLTHLVQKFLKRFRPNRSWSLGYACTCSKPRVGEFGGGAVFVTAERIVWQDSWTFLAKKEKRFQRKQRSAARKENS
jgi:hypothetical protein